MTFDDDEEQHSPEAFDKHRAKHQPRKLKINGHGLGSWARGIHAHELMLIEAAIQAGLTAGESNTEIAHRVVGSRRMNGSNGATEVTRQNIIRLGRGYLQKRKTRMGGASADGPAK